jgi:hypothetical protein
MLSRRGAKAPANIRRMCRLMNLLPGFNIPAAPCASGFKGDGG